METTAAQIVNYRGQAENALGSPAGGNSGATTIWGDTNADGINRAADALYLNALNKNKAIYDKKIADRDKMRDLLQSEKLQMTRMLPKDREYITTNFRDKARQMLIDNPDISSDPKKYQELQDLLDKFIEAKAYAGVRLNEIGKLDDEIAKETDPEKRARMQQHRDKLEQQDLYQEVKPYQQILDWSPDIFPDAAVDESTTADFEGDKEVTTTHFQSRLRDFTDKVLFNYIDSPNKTLKNQMDQFARDFYELPANLQGQKVAQWNNKIRQANEDSDYKPGDLYYVPPIAIDPNTGVVTATTPELVRAQAILEKYKKGESRGEKLSKLKSEIDENKSTARKNLAEATIKIPAETAKLYAEARKARADADKTEADAKKIRDELAQKDEQGNFYIQETIQAYNPKAYKGLGRLENNKLFVRNSEGEEVSIPSPVKGVTGTVVAYQNEQGLTITGLSDMQLNILGLRDKGAVGDSGNVSPGTIVTKPDLVVYNNQNAADPFFLARYTFVDDKGKKTYETRIIRPNQYIKAAIKDVLGEDAAGKEAEDYKATMRMWRKRTNSENINGTIMKEMEKDINQPQQSELEMKRSLFGKKK